MRTAYFDCFSGISGDMTVGALLDAGGDFDALRKDLSRLLPGEFELRCERVRRAGLMGTKFDVEVLPHGGAAGQAAGHGHHPHHRGLADVLSIVADAKLPARVTSRAQDVFRLLAGAEAQVHGIAVNEVHFHEVGAVDSIVDIVGACLLLEQLGIDRIESSPIVTGFGVVRCIHGELPVPAPATAELLKGIATIAGSVEGEAATPTGAALVAALAARIGPPPPMTAKRIGLGAGGRDTPGRPNLLRVIVGDVVAGALAGKASPGEAGGLLGAGADDATPTDVMVIEANLDDATGELIGYVVERLWEAGALDVTLSPVQMKKNRPGTLIRAIASPEKQVQIEEVLLFESTTFGVRSYGATRRILQRETIRVDTAYGPLAVKVGRYQGRVVTVSPEYEECARAARAARVALKDVMEAAQAAARQRTGMGKWLAGGGGSASREKDL